MPPASNGFGTGVVAAGGNMVARGVATLAPLQPLPSLPQAPDDAANDANVKEDDDDEFEIVLQQYKEESEAEEETQQAEEDTEPVEEPAMVEPSETPPDVRTLTHIETKCFAMPFGNRETFCFGTRSTICFAMLFGNRECFVSVLINVSI